jgi:hypothetical protein
LSWRFRRPQSAPIGQALTVDPLDRQNGAVGVREAQLDAAIIVEGGLVNVTLEMLLAAMLIETVEARLNTPKKPSTLFVVTSPRAYSLLAC